MIIDGEIVITGSFNFTKAAQTQNAENLLIVRDPALTAQYTQNWDAHRQHSQLYVGRGVREELATDTGVPQRPRATARRHQMRLPWSAIVWLPLVLLTACVASHTAKPPAGSVRPALDRFLSRGDIQVAEAHLQDFGFDPGPIDGIYTVQTQAAVRAYQARYGLPVSGLLDYVTRLQLLPGLDYQGPNP